MPNHDDHHFHLGMQVLRDRLHGGASDQPTTREAQHHASEEFRRIAAELRASWDALAEPPRRRNRRAA